MTTVSPRQANEQSRRESVIVVAEMQKEWLNFCRTQNVRHCHIITARLALLHWEWNHGMTPVMAADLADSDVIKEAAE